MNQPKSPTPVNRLSRIAITPVTTTVITALGLNPPRYQYRPAGSRVYMASTAMRCLAAR